MLGNESSMCKTARAPAEVLNVVLKICKTVNAVWPVVDVRLVIGFNGKCTTVVIMFKQVIESKRGSSLGVTECLEKHFFIPSLF